MTSFLSDLRRNMHASTASVIILAFVFSGIPIWVQEVGETREWLRTNTGLVERMILDGDRPGLLGTLSTKGDVKGLRRVMEPIIDAASLKIGKSFVIGFYSKDLDRVIVGRQDGKPLGLEDKRLWDSDPGRGTWVTRKPRTVLVWSDVRRTWLLKRDSPVLVNGRVIGHVFSNRTLGNVIMLVFGTSVSMLLALLVGSLFIIRASRRFMEKTARNLEALRLNEFDKPLEYREFADIAENNRNLHRMTADMLRNYPWGYAVVDSTGTYIDINDKGLGYMGVPREEFIGQPAVGFMMDDPPIIRAMVEDTVIDTEIVFDFPSGVRNLRILAFPITLLSGGRGAMAWFIDTTENRTMELHLQHMDRLATVGEMTSIVAHDIRNPLTSIKGLAQLAQVLPERAGGKEQWKRVDALVNGINEYLDKILSFCRPNNGDSDCTPVKAMFDNVLAMLSSKLGYSKVRTRMELPDPDVCIRANTLDFQHVLLNLTTNAFEAMEGAGEIVLGAAADGKGSVVITISDTGSGIPPEQLERIWGMYYTTKAKGNGIGLAMAKRVVEQQGGTIGVSSALGVGTTFTITLPDPMMDDLHGVQLPLIPEQA